MNSLHFCAQGHSLDSVSRVFALRRSKKVGHLEKSGILNNYEKVCFLWNSWNYWKLVKFPKIHEIHENGPPESTLLPWPSQSGDFGDFLHFFWEISAFLQKSWFPQKTILQKQKNRKSCKNTLLPHLVARAGAPFPTFPQIMVKFTKFHQSLVNSC